MTTWSAAPWTAQMGRRGSSPPSLPTTCWNNCTTSRKCSCSSQQEVGIRTRTCKRSRLAEDLVAADSSPEDRGVAGDGLSVVKVLVASLGNLAVGFGFALLPVFRPEPGLGWVDCDARLQFDHSIGP